MKNIIKIIIIGMSILGLNACTKVVEDITLPYEERLVVTAFIAPQDSLIEIKVSKTSPAIGIVPNIVYGQNGQITDPQAILNATVTLSDGTRTTIAKLSSIKVLNGVDYNTGQQVPGTEKKGYFINTKDFPIVAGKTYTLTVSAPNFKDVSATCTVPQNRLITKDIEIIANDKITSYTYPSGTGSGSIKVEQITKVIALKFMDFVGEENFYAISGFNYSTSKVKPPSGKEFVITNVQSIGFEKGSNYGYTNYLTDYKQDGQFMVTDKTSIFLNSNTNDPNYKEDPDQKKYVEFFVANTDKNYYEYNRTASIRNGDNPFSEPVLTFSNIKNGLGAFGAYNMTVVRLILK
jgi:Domain of unknown function (DUF4249)